MKKIAKQSLMVAIAAAMGFGAAVAQAQTAADRVYVIDQRGEVARSGTGLCWRTGFWTPAAAAKDPAGCACDKDLIPKEVCEPKAAAAAPAAPGAKPASSKVTLAADALFDFDKAVLRPEGKAKLDDLVSKMAGVSLEVIIAVGYTDRIGTDAHNLPLSQRRAAAVKDYLVSKGIEPNRIYTEGKGPANPVKQCPNPSAKGEIRNQKQLIECLQPNRRVEVEVVGTRPVKR